MPSEPTKDMSVVEWSSVASRLVKAVDRVEIRRLEARLGCTQAEAASHFIEDSCWSADLPEFSGGKGTPKDRRDALLAVWKGHEGEAGE